MSNLNKYYKDNIYFAEIKDTSGTIFLKIGVTSDFHNRIKSIQTGCPFRIKLKDIFYVPNAKKIESLIHKELCEYKAVGEWFEVTQENIKHINFIKERLEEYRGDTSIYNPAFEDRINSLLVEDL